MSLFQWSVGTSATDLFLKLFDDGTRFFHIRGTARRSNSGSVSLSNRCLACSSKSLGNGSFWESEGLPRRCRANIFTTTRFVFCVHFVLLVFSMADSVNVHNHPATTRDSHLPLHRLTARVKCVVRAHVPRLKACNQQRPIRPGRFTPFSYGPNSSLTEDVIGAACPTHTLLPTCSCSTPPISARSSGSGPVTSGKRYPPPWSKGNPLRCCRTEQNWVETADSPRTHVNQ